MYFYNREILGMLAMLGVTRIRWKKHSITVITLYKNIICVSESATLLLLTSTTADSAKSRTNIIMDENEIIAFGE